MQLLRIKNNISKYSSLYNLVTFAARITPARLDILSRRWGQMYPQLKELSSDGVHPKLAEKMGYIADGLESGVRGLPAAMQGMGGKQMTPVPILEEGTHRLLGISAMTPQNNIQQRMAYYPNPRRLIENDNPAWYPTTKQGSNEITPAQDIFRTLKNNYPGDTQVALSGNMGINESLMKSMGLPVQEAVERRSTNPNFLLNKLADKYDVAVLDPEEIASRNIRVLPNPERIPNRRNRMHMNRTTGRLTEIPF